MSLKLQNHVAKSSLAMDTTDYSAGPADTDNICALEWMSLALDAARNLAECEATGRFRLDYSQFYTEKLIGL
jgi:hypothetical protein